MTTVITEYNPAWLIYTVAAVILMAMTWLGSRQVKFTLLVVLLRSFVAAVLVTPALVTGDSGQWSPAFMSGIMEFMSGDQQAAQSRLLSILAVMLLFIVLALLGRFLRRKLRAKPASA